jgi:hypothetical protein
LLSIVIAFLLQTGGRCLRITLCSYEERNGARAASADILVNVQLGAESVAGDKDMVRAASDFMTR